MTQQNFALGQAIKSSKCDFYKIIQVLGEGKSATAFLALKTSSNDRGTFCVLKLMQHPSDAEKSANFNREQINIKSLVHSSIMQIRDDGIFKSAQSGESYPFYVCDFYRNNLSQFIRNDNVKVTQKLSFAIQLCSSLAYLSSNNIVHCDIKPDNIYTDGFRCVVADFGLSRATGATATNLDLPSLHTYRSPDIVDAINNGNPLTAKSDVFQLGLVLAELFTGKNPCLKRDDGSSKVFIDDIELIYGKYNKQIRHLLEEMLKIDANKRPDANSLIDRWQTVQFEAYDYLLEIDKNVF